MCKGDISNFFFCSWLDVLFPEFEHGHALSCAYFTLFFLFGSFFVVWSWFHLLGLLYSLFFYFLFFF